MSTEQLTGLQLAVKLLAQIGDDDSDRAIAAVHAVMDVGQPSELPEGLQLAVTLLDGDRDAFVVCHRHPIHGLEAADVEIAGEYIGAIDAIRAEHHQRLTLQHHACDLAQLVADLEAERDALRARLAEIEAQEPAAIIGSSYSIHYAGAEPISAVVARHGLKVGSALYARPVPAQAVPTGQRQAVLLADHMTDAHADAVLRAAGSALQYYTMQSTRDGIRQAVRATEAAVLAANGLEVRRG